MPQWQSLMVHLHRVPAACFSWICNKINSMSLHCQVRETVGKGRQTSGMIILSSHALRLLVNKSNKMLGSNSNCHASHIRIIQLEIESVQPPLEAAP